MLKTIDRFLNSITMYKLVLYGLLALAGYALGASIFGFLSFGFLPLVISLVIALFVTYGSTALLGRVFNAPINPESAPITGLILFFLMFPATSVEDAIVLAIACVIASASKFIFAPHKRHIFNPAAFAALLLGLFGNGNAVWWVGSIVMLPATIVLGLLIVRKIRKFTLFLSFLVASFVTVAAVLLIQEGNFSRFGDLFVQTFISWPIVFLGTVMLTEPFTMPPKLRTQVIYGVLVGVLSSIPFHIGIVYGTPELALVVGNIYSYIVGFKRRVMLRVSSVREIAKDIFEISALPDKHFDFHPGQYFEWTLAHEHPDSRGVRRYFTIASSPTENHTLLGVKHFQKGSSFKEALIGLKNNDVIAAGQLAGDFTLPNNPKEKLVFVAGGIGITPFRSMIKYLIDKKETRDIVLVYTVKSPDEIAYKEIFETARVSFGIKAVYVITEKGNVPPGWQGEQGFVDADMIKRVIPDFSDRRFYLSGPNVMVESYKKLLAGLGIKRGKIVTDYFPGF